MLKDFFSRLFRGQKTPAHFYGLYVRCDQCNEKISAHINMHNDLSIQYGETDKDNVYFVHKQLLGRERCFKPIDVELTFDNRRNLIDRQMSGGLFIPAEEFEGANDDE